MIVLNEPYANWHSPTKPNSKRYIKDIINLENVLLQCPTTVTGIELQFKFGLNTSKADLEILHIQRFTKTHRNSDICPTISEHGNLAHISDKRTFYSYSKLRNFNRKEGQKVTKPPSSAMDTKG